MLGDRHGRHLQLGSAIEQFADPAGAIEQGELGVQVQVDELRHAPTPIRSWRVVWS
jgi:hypothetical protein